MAAIIVFFAILAVSLLLAVLSMKGAINSNMSEVMTAGGSFGAFLIFFLSVGEIYSIGTLIGTPGAIYSKGASYIVWFIIYILLAYPIGYFLNPYILKMGKLSKANTISDLIGWRYNSKLVQVVSAIVAIMFLVPWVQNQFAGMTILYKFLNLGITPTVGIFISIALAFSYIVIAGIRAPAWVSVLKDILMVVGILIVGIVCVAKTPGGVAGIFGHTIQVAPQTLTVQPSKVPNTITTILLQMLGFYMLPFTAQATLTSKNQKILRKNSILMPLYMVMMPFLVIAAYFAVNNFKGLANPDNALLTVVVNTLPSWLVGLVAGGAALTAILVMAFVSLCVGGLFSKNILGVLKPGLSDKSMALSTRVVTGIFLACSAFFSLYFPALMLGVIALSYSGLTQFFVSIFFGFTWKRATKWGIVSGFVVSITSLFMITTLPYGIAKGFVALLINFAVTIIVSLLTKPDSEAVLRYEQLRNYDKMFDEVIVEEEFSLNQEG
jgi:solute:Na+ symporter, SSS family